MRGLKRSWMSQTSKAQLLSLSFPRPATEACMPLYNTAVTRHTFSHCSRSDRSKALVADSHNALDSLIVVGQLIPDLYIFL